MHEVLVNRLGGLSLPRKSVVRLTDRPDMTLDVYRGRKTIQHTNSVDTSFREDKKISKQITEKVIRYHLKIFGPGNKMSTSYITVTNHNGF